MNQTIQDAVMEEINFSGGINEFVAGLNTTARNSDWDDWIKNGLIISSVFYRSLYDIEDVDIESLAKRNIPRMIKLAEGLRGQKNKTASSILLSELIDITLSRIAVLRKVS